MVKNRTSVQIWQISAVQGTSASSSESLSELSGEIPPVLLHRKYMWDRMKMHDTCVQGFWNTLQFSASFASTWDSMHADVQTRLSSLSHLPFRLQKLVDPCTVATVFVCNCWTVFLSLVHVPTRALSCCFPFGRRTTSTRAAEGPSLTHISSAIDETFHDLL